MLWKTGVVSLGPRVGIARRTACGCGLYPVWRRPVLLWAGLLGSLWLCLYRVVLNNAAQSSYQQVVLHDVLSGVKARNVMTQQCQMVPAGVPLDRLVEDNILGQASVASLSPTKAT